MDQKYRLWACLAAVILPLFLAVLEIVNDFRIRKYCGRMMKEHVVLDCWKEVKKVNLSTYGNSLFNVACILLAVFIFFFAPSIDPRILTVLVASYMCTVIFRLFLDLWVSRCEKTINHRGHWSIEWTMDQRTKPERQMKMKWKS